MRRLLLTAVILLQTAVATLAVAAEAPLRFGVLAYRPKLQTLAQWQPLGAYLEHMLGRPIIITVHDHAELSTAVRQRAVDVVITTANHFILLQHTSGLSAPLATLVSREGKYPLTAYGGTIITRADRTDINTLADLRGKRIAAVSTDAFGGFQMQAHELAEVGLPIPHGDRLLLTGQPHDRVIEEVRAGRVDAGFVRTGILEALAHGRQIDLNNFKIINAQQLADLPYISSTRQFQR